MIIPSSTHPVVVTGAAGFIGSYLVKGLLREGLSPQSLLGVDQEAFFDSRSCAKGFRERGLKTMTPEVFAAEFSAGRLKPALIYHMGASSSTDEFREDYLRVVNVEYTQTLWRASTTQGIPFLYASSAATYGDGSQGFSDDPARIPALQPLNPYGWSKQRFDLFVLEELRQGRATPPIWAGFKFFNVYGPGEEHKGGQASVVVHARKQYESAGFMKLFRSHREGIKDGEQRRDFVWVGDIARAMHAFAKGGLRNGIYNLGTGQARTFVDLTRAVAVALGYEPRIEFIDTPERLRAGYQYFTQAELQNLRAAGYTEPFTSIEEGVRRTFAEWNDSTERPRP